MEWPEYERMYQVEDSHWWFVGRRQLARVLVERQFVSHSGVRILDIGCGTGANLAFLAEWGESSGIDFSPLALSLAHCRQLSRLTQASALTLPFAAHSFDLVTLFDVLYHRWVTDDTQVIKEVYRVLRPGGWLLLTDAALPGLWSVHDEVYYARQRYTLPAVRVKLNEAGFEAGIFSYANMLLLPFVAVIRTFIHWVPAAQSLDIRPLPSWSNRLLIGVRNLEALWLRWGYTLPLGSSLICLTQKPSVF